MVTQNHFSDGDKTHLLIEPNCSMTWRQNVWFFTGIASVSGSIALVLALKGYWLVFPFAGIELLFLGGCLYISACKQRIREVIEINAASVRIMRGRHRENWCCEFPRAWTSVRLEPAHSAFHPARLLVGSSGRKIEIGRCLSDEDRKGLAKQLKGLLAQ